MSLLGIASRVPVVRGGPPSCALVYLVIMYRENGEHFALLPSESSAARCSVPNSSSLTKRDHFDQRNRVYSTSVSLQIYTLLHMSLLPRSLVWRVRLRPVEIHY